MFRDLLCNSSLQSSQKTSSYSHNWKWSCRWVKETAIAFLSVLKDLFYVLESYRKRHSGIPLNWSLWHTEVREPFLWLFVTHKKKLIKKPLYPPLKGRVLIRDVNVFVFFTFLVLNKSLTKGSNSLVYDVDRVLLRSSVLFRNNKQCFLLQRDEIWNKKEEANSESPHSNGAFRSNHILSHSSCIWLVEKGYPSPTPRHENTVEHTG